MPASDTPQPRCSGDGRVPGRYRGSNWAWVPCGGCANCEPTPAEPAPEEPGGRTETRALLDKDYAPPEGIDVASLLWVANYAWAMANEDSHKGRDVGSLRGFVHALRGHARAREMVDTCCAWCRTLPPYQHQECPQRPGGGPCVEAKAYRAALSRGEPEAVRMWRGREPIDQRYISDRLRAGAGESPYVLGLMDAAADALEALAQPPPTGDSGEDSK